MQSSIIIISAVAFFALVAIFGWSKAPGIILGITATLSAVWFMLSILTA
jgi:hypothetical protein